MIPQNSTDRFRKVLATCQVEAVRLGHNYVGTEHLLIAALREDGVAAAAMRRMGVDTDRAVIAVKDILGKASAAKEEAAIDAIPFMTRTYRIGDSTIRGEIERAKESTLTAMNIVSSLIPKAGSDLSTVLTLSDLLDRIARLVGKLDAANSISGVQIELPKPTPLPK